MTDADFFDSHVRFKKILMGGIDKREICVIVEKVETMYVCIHG